MESGQVFDATVLGRQAACELKQVDHFLIVVFPMFGLDAAILSRADQEITSLQVNVFSQAKNISPTIAHMNPLAWREGWADGLHGSFPDQGFPIALETLSLCLVMRSRLPHKRFLIGQSEHFCGLGIDRQHGLHEETLGLFAATDRPQSLGFLVLRGIQIGRVLHQQDLFALPGFLTGVLPMGILQLLKVNGLVHEETVGSLQGTRISHLLG
jgi:hypothetical protein